MDELSIFSFFVFREKKEEREEKGQKDADKRKRHVGKQER